MRGLGHWRLMSLLFRMPVPKLSICGSGRPNAAISGDAGCSTDAVTTFYQPLYLPEHAFRFSMTVLCADFCTGLATFDTFPAAQKVLLRLPPLIKLRCEVAKGKVISFGVISMIGH